MSELLGEVPGHVVSTLLIKWYIDSGGSPDSHKCAARHFNFTVGGSSEISHDANVELVLAGERVASVVTYHVWTTLSEDR